jgi:hypothetical protein
MVRRKSREASEVGELVMSAATSTTRVASSSRSPVSRSTPVEWECPVASGLAAVRSLTACEVMSPVPEPRFPEVSLFFLPWDFQGVVR